MKKNISLFVILVGLIFLTYIFQEKRVATEIEEKRESSQVIKGEIKSLSFGDVNAVKVNDQWWHEKELLSHNSMKIIERKVSEIMKIKEIEGDWKSYFSEPFTFKVNDQNYTLGELSLDKQGFYLAQDRKIILSEIIGSSHELTRDESAMASIKLDEFKRELSKKLKDLKENQLFRYYPGIPFDSVTIDTEGNLPFELNFKTNETLPPPIPGINTHKDLKNKFMSLLTQVNLKSEIPYSEKLKFKKLSQMKYLSKDKEITWDLWLKGKDSADAVLIDPDQKRAFLMVGGTLKIFFIHVQDYWDKKVIPPKAFENFTAMKMTFIQGSKKANVEVLNKEPLGFKVQGYKLKPANMQELLFILFNLGETDQADRVSLLSKSEKQQVLSEDHLRVDVMNQELLLWRKDQELIVVNLTQGFKAHFGILEKSLRFKFEDVLE